MLDAVISAHDLEHCDNRDATLSAMLEVVKPGGKSYLSFHTEKSVDFPKRGGGMNYYADKTHKDKPPEFNWVIGRLAAMDCSVEFAARRYRPILLFTIGVLLEPYSRLKNRSQICAWEYLGSKQSFMRRKRMSEKICLVTSPRSPSVFRRRMVMHRVIAVLFLLFASPCLAEAQAKSYQFGECLGHETICDDEFNEVIILSVDDGGAISTDIQFNHPHIVEISAGKMTLDGNGFNSAHSIINNLGYEFTFEITGDAQNVVAEAVIIHLGEEHLASIKLVSITQ